MERNKLKEFQSQMDKYISNMNEFKEIILTVIISVEILILNQEIKTINTE